MKRKQFIAYYRVSTDKQANGHGNKSGVTGLGLKSQKDMIKTFLKSYWPPVAEFTEVQSGKSDKNRIELHKAISFCKKVKGCLVVAKLDRLSRDLHFITALQKNKIDFKVVDMPEATPLTINIFGAMAQHEREMISKRTSAALQQLKSRGVKLGSHNPKVLKVLQKLWAKKRAAKAFKIKKEKQTKKPKPKKIGKTAAWDKTIVPTIQILINQGKSLQKISDELNKANIKTRQSGNWHQNSVYQICLRNNLKLKRGK